MRPVVLALALLLLSGLHTVVATTPSGRQIALDVDQHSRSETQTYFGRLEVRDGKSAHTKAWKVWRSGWGSAARSLLVFTAPAEVRGVTLLTVGKAAQPDLQWMYTPAIDKTRRIAPQEKKTRFLGTHFSYEDMEFRDVDDRDYELIGEETKDNLPCWVLWATPKQHDQSQYERIRYWVRKDLMVFHDAQYFIAGRVRRQLALRDYSSIQGIPTPRRWEMSDSEKPGITVLTIEQVRYNEPIDERFFAPGARPDLP